jgi:hypothetical protein
MKGINIMKKTKVTLINVLRMLVADYILLGVLKLYPQGADRDSLCIVLNTHFKMMLGDVTFIDREKDKRAGIS